MTLLEFSLPTLSKHTHSACQSSSERTCTMVCISQVQECPLQLASEQPFSLLRRVAEHSTLTQTRRWPNTRTPDSHTAHPPLLHSRVVTQQGFWLVMEPVSHPANINQAHTPPPSSDQMAQGRHQGTGPAVLLGAGWAKSQMRTIFHPHFSKPL